MGQVLIYKTLSKQHPIKYNKFLNYVMTKYPFVCIIILNWNGKELLEDCLSSLFRLTSYSNYKVIVVDNDSNDGSVAFVKKNFSKADILILDKNYGFSKGNNDGIKYTLKKYNSDYILLLNNDTKIIQKNWLTKMVEVAESDKKIGVVGCKMLFPDKRIQHAGTILKNFQFENRGYLKNDNSRYDFVERTFSASGACFLIKNGLFYKIGLLDEIYTPFLAEESDFFFRTIKAGFKIMYCGKSKVIHKSRVSLNKVEDCSRFFIEERNGLIFYFRYFPSSAKILEIFRWFMKCFLTRNANKLHLNKTLLRRLSIFNHALEQALVLYKISKTPKISKRVLTPEQALSSTHRRARSPQQAVGYSRK